MSSTTVFAILHDGTVVEAGDAHNSHGTAPIIWRTLANKYGVRDPLGFTSLLGDPGKEPMWSLHETHPLDATERAVLVFSFDRAYVRSANIPKLCKALREFYRRHGTGFVDTMMRVAEILETVATIPDVQGACFQITSMTDNPWWVRSDDQDEGRLFVFGQDVVPANVIEIFDEPIDWKASSNAKNDE